MGEPPVVGPFNVVDFHLTVAMNVIDLAARRPWVAVGKEKVTQRYSCDESRVDGYPAVKSSHPRYPPM